MTFFANNRKPVFDRRLDFDFLSAASTSTSVNDVLMMTMPSTLFGTLFSSSYRFRYL